MIKKFAASMLGATALLPCFAPTASADGYLTDREQNYGDTVWPVICNEFDESGVTGRSLYIVANATARAGHFSIDNAVDVINYVVYEHCSRHWGDLVIFGKSARGEI